MSAMVGIFAAAVTRALGGDGPEVLRFTSVVPAWARDLGIVVFVVMTALSLASRSSSRLTRIGFGATGAIVLGLSLRSITYCGYHHQIEERIGPFVVRRFDATGYDDPAPRYEVGMVFVLVENYRGELARFFLGLYPWRIDPSECFTAFDDEDLSSPRPPR